MIPFSLLEMSYPLSILDGSVPVFVVVVVSDSVVVVMWRRDDADINEEDGMDMVRLRGGGGWETEGFVV